MIALDFIILVPLLLAIASPLAAQWSTTAPRWIALSGPVAQLALLLSLSHQDVFTGARLAGGSLPAVEGVWSVATDGLSTPLLALTAVIGMVAVSASWRVTDRPGGHFGLLLVLQAALAGVFLADNLILFYVAWESALVPMFLLIGGWGSSNARRAAMKFLVYTFAGGAVLLVGVIYVSLSTGSVLFESIMGRAGSIASPTLAFWLLAIGFLVKLPAIPFHTWLPDAHTEAPTAGSIVLAGVLLKMGGYGLMRLALPFAPVGFAQARPILAALGIAGIVWGAATALVQTDLKRLVAYSSVAHMGFVLLAIAVASPLSLGGALLGMVSHGLVAGLLFYLVGAVYERAHTRELAHFGGLGSVMPRWATAFVFFALASAGLPGLSGFPGEFLTLTEGFSTFSWWMVVAGLGVVLAAAYNLRAIRATVQGPVGEFAHADDLGRREGVTALLIGSGVVVLGLAPWLVLDGARGTLEFLARAVWGGV